MKKETRTINGFTLWNRSYNGMVFARQLEPTEGIYGDMDKENTALRTPILVGKDGEYGRDLVEILEENEKLKTENTNLKNAIYEDERKKWYELDRRLTRIETRNPWWKRLISV